MLLHSAKRSLSTLPSASSIYVSTSTSPYFNLSLEDWLFRKAPPQKPLLLLYRNDACVVIGRNQNPWKEVNFSALRTHGIPLIRRRSGGGTVYHDLGNTNFSIHLPRETFNRHHTAQLVQRALVHLGIDAEINERNDICVDGFKVSGSAYKIVHSRAYHHGTMLISTDLAGLRDVLRNTKDGMVTKGVASVRSPVHNLRQFSTSITHSAFVDAVAREFTRKYDADPQAQIIHEIDETRGIDHIRDGMVELGQWEWKYGQTPEFTHRLHREFEWGKITAELSSKRGIISSCSFASSSPAEQARCDRIAQSLVGVRYAFLESPGAQEDVDDDMKRRCIIDWLREDM